ncbi:MAG TPA: AAA family ATPase [Propionibacteriaceae bacterium]|nr:AAA family ATPase [Propionibacteriaceae bacterium]
MISTIAVHGYRSLRELRVPLAKITLVTGANGTGKSSLYRALRLLADCAEGQVIGSLAREGGLPSTLWAGPEVIGKRVRSGEYEVEGTLRSERVSLQLGFASDEFSYLIDLGIPIRADSAFNLDPEIKRELVWSGPVQRPATLLVRRRGPLVELRDGRAWEPVHTELRTYESVLTEVIDPVRAPELLWVREQVRSWRFYDHFRTDAEAPARQAQIGTRTPVLHHDGRDLAAALQTIGEIGDVGALQATITDAFPGSELTVQVEAGRFDLQLGAHGLLRPLGAAELSDGTLRYLLLVAALLSPRPPGLMVLNEPETSLHPDLLAPLARLIGRASATTQIVVVSHSAPLIHALQGQSDSATIELVKDFGETRVAGLGQFDGPVWQWGSR